MFVLVMVTFVGIGVGPMLGSAFAATKAATAAMNADNGFYAADGGVEYAIQDLRGGAGSCAQSTVGPAGTLAGPGTLNGVPVAISATCSTATSTSTQQGSSSILVATITSTASISPLAGGGVSTSQFTATAVVDINEVAPTRNTSIVSWSSLES
jgi:hypothetical protein